MKLPLADVALIGDAIVSAARTAELTGSRVVRQKRPSRPPSRPPAASSPAASHVDCPQPSSAATDVRERLMTG